MFKNENYLLIIIAASLLVSTSSFGQEKKDILKINRNDDAAVKILQNAVSNNPNSKSAKLVVAKVYLKNDRFKEAEDLLFQILEEDPDNKKANDLLKDLERAITEYEAKNKVNKQTKNIIKVQPVIDKNSKETDFIVSKPKPVITNINENSIEKANKKNTVNENNIEKANKKTVVENINTSNNKVDNSNNNKKVDPKSTVPSTIEIIKKAKQRKTKNNKTTDDKPIQITVNTIPNPNKIQGNKGIVSNSTSVETPNNNQTLTSDLSSLNNSESIKNKALMKKKNEKKQNNDNETSSLNNKKIGNNENIVLKPFVSNQFKKKSDKDDDNEQDIQQQNNTVRINNNDKKTTPALPAANNFQFNTKIQLSDTSKTKFLEATTDSFSVNLEEAYSRIERNDLEVAKFYLNRAFALAANEKNTKKLYDVQLSRAVIYMYQCDFKDYGDHIFSIRKGLSENVYQSLHKVYEAAMKLPDASSQYKYVANLALKSGHYYTALDLAKRVTPQDKESRQIIEKSNAMIKQINGEYLLNNGSFIYALDYFENKNDEAEKGRTYLAISKSLFESNEPKQAKIAEQFGRSCLMNYIENDQNNPKANLYLALYMLDKGDKNQAKEAIRRGLNAQGTNEVVTSKLLNLAENL